MLHRLEDVIDPFPADEITTPPAGPWRFLVRELRPLRAVFLISLLFTVVGSAFEVWLIGYAGRLVDTLATTSPQQLWVERGTELVVVGLLVLVGRPLLALFNEGLDDLAFRPNAKSLTSWRAHRYVSRQPVSWFRADLSGRIAQWVLDTGSSASTAAYVIVHTLAAVAVYIAGSVWLMAAIDPRLVVPLAVWIVLYAVLMAYVVPRYRRASHRQQEANSALTGLLVDSYANVDSLGLLAGPAEEDRESRKVFAAARAGHIAVQRVEVTMNTAMNALSGVLMVGLIGYGIVLWRQGAAPLGLVAAALALSFRITSMAEWLLDAVSALFGSLGSLRRTLQAVAQPLAVRDEPGATTLSVRGGAIRFVDVSHHYGNGAGGLDGLSLDIAAGEKVGLVGRSGAGKSTMINLVLRFFDPERGRVEIDGQDIRTVTQESLRARIAMVTQDATLLHRSVRANIAHDRDDEAGVVAAAQKAAADDFIRTLRDQDGRTGYEAHAGERGVRLSGGQRQRIALARAIYKDAPILLLDEATSALDSEVEAAIQESLDEVMSGRTVIAIAHRLSTIARMDRIVVVDGGRVAEQGSHDELLAAQGLYADLWARQSGGFL